MKEWATQPSSLENGLHYKDPGWGLCYSAVVRDTIKNNIESWRQKAGMTQAVLAERVGVTRQTIIAIEKGDYAPSVALALKLARIFKCRVEDLFKVS